jgi:hypothetical protein
MISGKMKLLSAVVSAAALLATPALASRAHKKKVSGHDVHASRTQPGIYSWDGRYLGWDPDPNIRFQLMRDQNLPPD